jgi:hypothetical protein
MPTQQKTIIANFSPAEDYPLNSHPDSTLQHIIHKVLEKNTAIRSLKLALVVGTILVMINQGDRILHGQALDWFKVILTYLVPYGVSTWTSVAKDLEILANSHK